MRARCFWTGTCSADSPPALAKARIFLMS